MSLCADWELATERLRISRLLPTQAHAHFIVELYNSPLFLEGQGATGIDTDEKAMTMITGFIAGLFAKQNHAIYLVSLRDHDSPDIQTKIGTVSIMKGATITVPDIGFALLPRYTGNGFAREAGTAMIKYAMQDKEQGGLGYDGVFGFTNAANAKSRKVCTSLGLEFRGVYPLAIFGGGKSAVFAKPGMRENLKEYGIQEERSTD